MRISDRARVRAGADIGVERFTTDEYGVVDDEPGTGVVRAPHTVLEGGVYGEVGWRPVDRVELVPGLRLDGYQIRGRTVWAPQPRVAGKVQIAPKVTWISAFGVAHQEPTEEVFVPAKLPDPIVDANGGDSYQFSEAIEARLPSGMRARATAFYSTIVARDATGEDRSEGLELFLRRDFTQRLGRIRLVHAVALGLARRRPDAELDAIRGDRRHLLSVVLGYDVGSGWRVGGRLFFESGRRYQTTCPTPECTPSAVGPGTTGYLVTGNLPPFYRVDARIEKKWSFHGGAWLTGTLECFNVLDKAEPTQENYSPAAGLVVTNQSSIILPSIGLEGGF